MTMSDGSRLEDKAAISELIQGWMFRDLGEWDRLRSLFHADGTIEVTWFEGRFSDFVTASMRMGVSDLRTKHLIGVPRIRLQGERAIVETNAVIICENTRLGLGCDAHSRLFDLAERRDGVWRLLKRSCLYDMAAFTFPLGAVGIDAEQARRYPREYAALAYLLGASGFPVARIFPTRGSDAEKSIRVAAERWLEGIEGG